MEKSAIEILSRIDRSVAQIASKVASQGGVSEKDGVSALSKGDVKDMVKAEDTSKAGGNNISLNSINDVSRALSKLSPSVKDVAGMSGKTINSFVKVITKIIGTVGDLAKSLDTNKKGMESLKVLTAVLKVIPKAFLGMIGAGLLAPAALIGVTLTVPVFMMYGLLMGLIGKIGIINIDKSLQTLEKSGAGILKLLASAILVLGVCVGLGYLVTNPKTKSLLFNAGKGFAALLLGVMGLAVLTAVTGDIAGADITTKGIRNIFILTGGAMLLIVTAKFLGDFVSKNVKSILTGLGSTAGVIVALVGVGWTAGKLLSKARRGIAALKSIELLAAGAMAIMAAAVGLSKLAEGKAKEISLTLLGVVGIITAFGALAYGVSYIAPQVILGSSAIGAVTLFALGSIGIATAAIGFHKLKEKSGVGWKQIAKDILGVEAVTATFGVLSAAMLPIGAAATLAMPAIGIISGFAAASMGIVYSAVRLQKSIDKAGGAEKLKTTLGTDIPAILKNFTIENFGIKMSISDIRETRRKFRLLKGLTSNFADVAKSLGTIAEVTGVVDDAGNIKPVLATNPITGKITYGEPVNLVNVASTITNAVSTFVNGCNYGMQDIKNMLKASLIFDILKGIVNPMSKFINVLTGFVGGTEQVGDTTVSTLAPIHFDSNGNAVVGKAVDIVGIARTITSAVGSFVSTLYDEANTGKWMDKIYGGSTGWDKLFHGGKNKNTQAIMKVTGILGVVVAPISDFVNMITKLSSDNGETLRTVSVDSEGKTVYGPDINVKNVSSAIAKCVNSFVDTLYNKDQIDNWKNLAKIGEESFEKMATSISGFIDVAERLSDIKKINSSTIVKNTNAIIKYINSVILQGVPKTQKVLMSFNKTLTSTKNGIKGIDDVLQREKDARKRNLEEFGNSIEALMQKFSGANDSIGKLHDLMMALQNMDADRVSSIIKSLNISGSSSASTAARTDDNTTGAFGGLFGNKKDNDTTSSHESLKAAFIDALESVFENARLEGGMVNRDGDLVNNIVYQLDVSYKP